MAGLIVIGIGVNTFINGVWLLLYNSQSKRIERIEEQLIKYFNKGEK